MRKTSPQSGFTLIETLVSITILLIVIAGPLAITSSSAKSSAFSSEQVTAFFLAQEGVELVEKARDDLLLTNFANTNPDPWVDFTRINGGIYRNCYTSANASGCDFTINRSGIPNLTLTNCNSGCELYLNKAQNNLRSRYTHNSSNATLTPYTRVITLEPIGNATPPNEVKVTSRVTWRTGSIRASQEVVVESVLANVYGN